MTNNLALPLLVSSYLAFSQLLIVWAVLGRCVPWFFRLSLLLGWMGLTLLAGADEMVLLVALTAGILLPGIMLILWRTGHYAEVTISRRFRLIAIGQFTAIVAACIALGSQVKGTWPLNAYFILAGFPAALLLLAVCMRYSQRTFWKALGTVFFLVTTVSVLLVASQGSFTRELFDVDDYVQMSEHVLGYIGRVVLLLSAPAVVIAVFGLLSVNAHKLPWVTNVCHGVAKLGIVTISCVNAAIAYHMAVPITLPATDMPEPNAYQAILDLDPKWRDDDFVIPNQREHGGEACMAFVAEHEQAIERIRQAMGNPGKVIVQESDDENYLSLLAASRIGVAMRLKAEYAEPSERILIARDLLRLGQLSSVGGLLEPLLYAQRMIRPGVAMIAEQRTQLDRNVCLLLLQDLQSIDEAWEPLELIRQREVAYVLRKGDWRARLVRMTHRLGDEDQFVYQSTSFGQVLARLRLLQAELALRAFYLENDRWPAQLDELVPRYLVRVPLDPFANKPLVYRTTEEGYLLYSVADNGVDDGGKLLDTTPLSAVAAGDMSVDVDALDRQAAANEK